MEKEKHGSESSSQIISHEDEQQINHALIYEKWRDEGKNNHKNRDIEKKMKKANAAKKAKKALNAKGNPPFEQ